jgi:pimeloyl-ACP methyl ester carboxylesterase
MSIEVTEGWITLAGPEGHKIFTKKFQNKQRDSSSVNLVIIHGGPGINFHEELLGVFIPTLFQRTELGSVLFYDQLGCGSSDKPNDPTQYSIKAFVNHLSLIIGDMNHVVLLGYSFGGQVAMEWLCTAFTGNVHGIIISNSPLDEATYCLKQKELRLELDLDVQMFYEQEENDRFSNGSIESLVYTTLIGRGESQISGSMKSWGVMDRIIPMLETVPVLFLSGNFDTIPYEEYERLRNFATVRVIPDAGHSPFYETPGEYWDAITRFFDENIQK